MISSLPGENINRANKINSAPIQTKEIRLLPMSPFPTKNNPINKSKKYQTPIRTLLTTSKFFPQY